ncbi:DUF5709 domain-containing protein [Mycobacterium kansasii]|uniref:DUF5709 domain-containing protein n=3 Tax=Mycobacterium kansasii TaxID=1768 RepID=A0A1V3XM57_MYCKA|nr:DUF5709 domain-containing protein [Mycobacterium kansasii]EUA01764.1 hypothetical protein I547_3477 [Mycobacterium kansasii 824]AGZ50277.1 hypothetical protein MKAN_08285 [Mycobacterium kansasii ATCC 12478]ARG57884.1 hypothetical protein B1T43_20830 [Mycobacterium kansasii]ARG63398.1 hypothetical protein B1T45_21340 [Mycobacterium kansasii]ARG71035.1 hypothetical protein B1T47_20635 [Mycobacterium kansasii]
MSNAYWAGPAAGEYGTEDDNQLQPEDTLIDRGVDDILDEGYSPPERPYAPGAFGPSETLDQLLAEEEPDPASRIDVLLDEDERQRSDEAEREAEFPRHGEVGRARAGRLVAPDLGFGEDTEAELVAEDVGISGGAASAEEAAMHIIEDGD